ncbi:hypothetical protein FXO37_26519 [Capsicum annuum]|nr:hypothetical protein FXO37_26519 [Capsicum annuum]
MSPSVGSSLLSCVSSTYHLKHCATLLIIKKGKSPNDYYLFEVSTECRENAYWGIRLEYENKDWRWRRKERTTQSPKIFPVPRKDTSVTTKSVCYIVLEQPEPSLPSSSLASTEHDIATDSGLYLGYEKKSLEVDQATMTVQKEHKSQNVQLIRVCGSPSRKMDDTSRKRKRRRNRKKRRKIAGTDESSLHDFDGS